ncbi:hypothetical protein [Algihabitans albus]|uniref:hypothetical protein n=1 Tax=Algihabitans albus TaxID=2164067 RepID=UPI000E5C76B1|nr:hypothetical protein [Algihabitans albus]
MINSHNLERADFEAAAAAAAGRSTTDLLAETGLPAGPSRWMLAVGELRLPLRVFVALALQIKGLEGAAPTTAEARMLALDAGLTPYDGHLAEAPLRTG